MGDDGGHGAGRGVPDLPRRGLHHWRSDSGVGRSTAFDDRYHLERARLVRVLAMSTGRPVKRVADNVPGAFLSRVSRR